MDQPKRPEDATQLGPPPAWPPDPPISATPPPGWPPDPPISATPPPWAVPAEPVGPAPGVRFAPHGPRLVAYIVDSILLVGLAAIISLPLAAALGVAAAGGDEPIAVAFGVLIFAALLAVTLGYFPFFWASGGATPGMRLFRLRLVRDHDGGPVGWGAALLRLLGFWVSSLVFYLGFAWILIDSRRRGWHDLLAGTVMVQPL
jgi:uncharacterized RDD family membrane protein YckC